MAAMLSAMDDGVGEIVAALDQRGLRDNTLVQAQAQIDQFAASMASALSDKTTDGTAAPASLPSRPSAWMA